ncbi:hypothetical protein K413DRAFT_3400 [Clostridium sp. ASBs410]|jgi:hypothetical protein|nr:hypothetical protein K413DRAFT_3400 [Clostridium sp. ASBs410]
MIFWICVAFAVIFHIMYFMSMFHVKYLWETLGAVCIAVSIVMLVFIIILNCGTNGIVSSNKEKYKALMYKAQTEACRDEFGIVNKDYIDEIQEWNQYIAKNKTMQRDFWFGVFVPNIFDEFQTIDLESIAYKK